MSNRRDPSCIMHGTNNLDGAGLSVRDLLLSLVPASLLRPSALLLGIGQSWACRAYEARGFRGLSTLLRDRVSFLRNHQICDTLTSHLLLFFSLACSLADYQSPGAAPLARSLAAQPSPRLPRSSFPLPSPPCQLHTIHVFTVGSPWQPLTLSTPESESLPPIPIAPSTV